jgi:hypothetical protein
LNENLDLRKFQEIQNYFRGCEKRGKEKGILVEEE